MNRKMRKALREQIAKNEQIIMSAMLTHVSDRLQVKKEKILSTSRHIDNVEARQLCQYLIAQVTDISEAKIAKFFKQDSSTVYYTLDKVEDLLEVNDEAMLIKYNKCIA